MSTCTPLRVALPRPARIVFVSALLLAGAAVAQPPRPAPLNVERVPAAPPPAPATADSPAHPDFSGVWVLNAKESDDPRPVFETMMPTDKPAGAKPGKSGGRGGPGVGVRGSSSDGSGMGGGGMGGGMGGGRGGGMGDSDDVNNDSGESGRSNPGAEAKFGGGADPAIAAKARRDFATRMTAAWQRLLIAQAGPEVEIIDGSEQSRVHVLDGQRRDRRGTRAASLETARWEGDEMVITLEQNGRPGMTQSYRLDPEAKRLYVTLRIPTRGQGAEKVIRLVYESA